MAAFDVFEFADGIEPFAAFLETMTYADQLHVTAGPISLIESIELWLWLGDGLGYCPSFPVYQTVVLRITNNWIDHGQVGVGAVEPVTLWPYDATVFVRLMPEQDPEAHLRSEYFEQLRGMHEIVNLKH